MPEWVFDIFGELMFTAAVAALVALVGLVYALLTGKSPAKTITKFLDWLGKFL